MRAVQVLHTRLGSAAVRLDARLRRRLYGVVDATRALRKVAT